MGECIPGIILKKLQTDPGLEFDWFASVGKLVEAIAQALYYYNNKRIHTKLKMSPIKFLLSRDYMVKEMGT